MTNITSPTTAATAMSLAKIYELLSSIVADSESSLNATVDKLSGNEDLGQEQLMALQAKIQSWGNLTSTATGLLRAVGDSLKSTTQNIR